MNFISLTSVTFYRYVPLFYFVADCFSILYSHTTSRINKNVCKMYVGGFATNLSRDTNNCGAMVSKIGRSSLQPLISLDPFVVHCFFCIFLCVHCIFFIFFFFEPIPKSSCNSCVLTHLGEKGTRPSPGGPQRGKTIRSYVFLRLSQVT